MAEKRKIKRLEEEVEELEGEKQKLTQEKRKLSEKLEEATIKIDDLEKKQRTYELSKQFKDEKNDPNELLKQIKSLQEQVDSKDREIREAKSKISQKSSEARSNAREEVFHGKDLRDLQVRIESLEKQLEEEKLLRNNLVEEEAQRLKTEFIRQHEKDKNRGIGSNRGRIGGQGKSPRTSNFSLTGDYSADDQSKELSQLKRKLEKTEERTEKDKQRFGREIERLNEDLQSVKTAREKAETKCDRLDKELKELQRNLEAEGKKKFNIESEKLKAERETKDLKVTVEKLSNQLKDQIDQGARNRKEAFDLQVDLKNLETENTKLKRDYDYFKKEMNKEIDNNSKTDQRRITYLENEVKDLKAKLTKVEKSETELTNENRVLKKELGIVKGNYEQAKDEFAKEKKDFLRQIERNVKMSEEEQQRLKEDLKKQEDRRRKEHELLESFQKEAEKLSTPKVIEKQSSAFDDLAEKRLNQEIFKLKELLAFKEKQYEEEIDSLQKSLRETETKIKKERQQFQDDMEENKQSSDDQKKKLEQRDKERKKQLEEAQEELLKEKALNKQLKEEITGLLNDIRILENDLDDERDERDIENEKALTKIKYLNQEIEELTKEATDLALDLKKVDNLLREKDEECITLNRNLEDTKVLLSETKEDLEFAEKDFEELSLKSKQKIQSLERKLEVLSRESKEETREKEKQNKMRVRAERKVEELEWYFMPSEQKEVAIDKSGPLLKLEKKKRDEIKKELEEISSVHAFSKKHLSVKEMKEYVVKGLQSIPEGNKEAFAYQLQGLIQALQEADFPDFVQMSIAYFLVEGLVDPEIIRELRLLTEIMVEDSLHFMDTPECVVKLAKRDVEKERTKPENKGKKATELLSPRDALLNRLSQMRAWRMNKPFELVKEGILDEIYTKIDG